MNKTRFGLIGSGSQAREVLDFSDPGDVSFILSSNTEEIGCTICGIPVYNFERPSKDISSLAVIPAVGAPGLKRKLITQWNGTLANAVRSETAYISPNAKIGAGTIIAPNAVVMTGTQIGMCVLVNVGVTISHDTKIGDFCTISPGVNIGGSCNLKDGVFVGIGATIIQGIEITSGSYVAAGAVVTENITKSGTYAGVPARLVNENNVWAIAI